MELVPWPPNFGGWDRNVRYLSTEFRASGADMYGTLIRTLPFGSCLIPNSPKVGGLTYPLVKFYANFWNISEEALSLAFWSTQYSVDNFLLWAIVMLKLEFWWIILERDFAHNYRYGTNADTANMQTCQLFPRCAEHPPPTPRCVARCIHPVKGSHSY